MKRTARTVLAVLALSSVGLASACGGSDGPPVSQAAPPLPVTTTASAAASTPSASPAAAPSRPVPPPVAADQERFSFFGARMAVPRGWQYEQESQTPFVCVDPTDPGECLVSVVNPVAATAQGEPIEQPDPDGAFGWYLGTDQASCLDANNPDDGLEDGALTSRIVERGLRPLGTKRAEYRAWALTCQGTRIGTARMWWLPTSKLAIITTGPSTARDADVDRFVAQIDASSYDASGRS